MIIDKEKGYDAFGNAYPFGFLSQKIEQLNKCEFVIPIPSQ